MAFTIPQFPLTCSIWRTGWSVRNYTPADITSVCNLTPGERHYNSRFVGVNSAAGSGQMYLLLPKLTDVRASYNGNNLEDLVEVPAGSKRFYQVQYVDDVAKGFPNEYRFAVLAFTGGVQTFADIGATPVPVPLP